MVTFVGPNGIHAPKIGPYRKKLKGRKMTVITQIWIIFLREMLSKQNVKRGKIERHTRWKIYLD